MRYLNLKFLLPLLVVLQACSGGSGSGAGGVAVFDGTEVKWSPLPAMQARVPQGTTPLIFTFSSNRTAYSNGVTEADWERTAAKFGMGISDLKSSFGGSAYKGPDGELRTCTLSATQRGLCKSNFQISVAQRAKMARRTLGEDARCRWTGFDPAYHQSTARMLGAESVTLHVAAACG